MFALVVLARRGLWIHHCDHRSALAEFASKVIGTTASVVVDSVHTSSAVLAHVILAVVNIFGAIVTAITSSTFTSVMREMVDTFRSVLTRIEGGSAKVNLLVTELASKSGLTLAGVRLHSVNASRIVLASVVHTVIDIYLTTSTGVTGQALTTESTLFQHSASGIVTTWITVTGVNHELAAFTMITRRTETLELLLCHWHALGIVLARERIAGVAL